MQKHRPGAFVRLLYHRISDDRVLAISAGVTFYALLAIFPALAAMVSIYGIFADVRTIHADLSSLHAILPGGAIRIIGEDVQRVALKDDSTLGLAAIVGLAVSLWSANAGVKALFDALNIVLREKERRSFLVLNAVSLAFTLAGVVFVLGAALFVIALPAWLAQTGVGSAVQSLVLIARWPLLWFAITLGIAVLYRFGPGCNDIPWRWISWGSAFASIAWVIASLAFSFYAANFGSFDKTYGSLGAVIGFMTWIWISVMIVLIGEELNEALDNSQQQEKASGDEHPLRVTRRRAWHSG